MKRSILNDLIEAAPNRRKFVQRIGLASAAATAMLGVRPANAQATDTDILNFALNLEYLEAEFYTVATTGMTIEQLGIPVNGTGSQGPTTGGRRVIFDNSGGDREQRAQFQPITDNGRLAAVAKELAFDEQAHVKLLRAALGGAAIAKPAINLNALGFGFNSRAEFLALARAFEDVGVTAYAGAAPLIASKEILATAARILGTEAEHAGNIRLQVAEANVATNKLDGVDILPPPSGTKFFSVDNNALVQVRTPGQVLYIVYGFVANATSGGFFPNGVNGAIRMSSGPA